MTKKLLQHISLFGIGVYLLALLVVTVAFREHAMQVKWILWGVGEVLFFFLMTLYFYPWWKDMEEKRFRWTLFLIALVIRVAYVVLISYYYYYQTGIAFEYHAADSLGYHKTAVYLSQCVRHGQIAYIFKYLNAYTMGYSDQGYVLWLTLIYSIFGRSLLTPRLLKALMSAYLCLVVYRLGTRSFGERTGRLAAVMCVFMPIFIQMAGLQRNGDDLSLGFGT